MAQREYPNRYNDRPNRTQERAEEWRGGRNGEYQPEGWDRDYERDSSLGEYYPTDNYFNGADEFSRSDFVPGTGGRMPRSLQENRETGYNDRQRTRGSQSYGQRDNYTGRGYGDMNMGYRRDQQNADYRGAQNQYGDTQQAQRNFRGHGPKGYKRSNERIHEDICERLSDDHYVDASDVMIEVNDGVVTLQGTIANRQMKHRLEDIVAECSGVQDIHNRITVSGNPGAWSNNKPASSGVGAGATAENSSIGDRNNS